MELITLRYFVMVAQELHFRRAAQKLNITQGPLSTAMKKLEDELETKLFERTSRSVRLTPAGEFFRQEAEAVLNRAEQATQRLREMLTNTVGKLTIGYNEPALNSFLPQVLAKFRQDQPDLQLELHEMETAEQLAYLRRGKLDIGLMRPTENDLYGLESRLIYSENYRLMMLANHPLAHKEAICSADLVNEEIILFARTVNPTVYDRLVAALTFDAANPPHFREDARNKNSMLLMVKAGFGAALLPESCCVQRNLDLVAKPLLIELPPVNIMAVWDPCNLTPMLKKFISALPWPQKEK